MSPSASLEHVLAELTRLDVLLRVQAWRVRAAHGDDPDLAGLYAPDTEPDTLLDRPLGTPPWAPVELADEVRTAVGAALDRCTQRVAELTDAASAAGAELRLARLAVDFGLTRFDLDVVLTCLAPELDGRYPRIYGYLHDDLTRRRPSVELVLTLFLPDVADRVAARARFDPDAPLRRARLLELCADPDRPESTLLDASLRLTPRVVAHLLGDDAPDERLRPFLLPDPGLPDLPEGGAQLLDRHCGAPHVVVHAHGDDPLVRRAAAVALARRTGREVVAVDGAAVAALAPADLASVVALADREVRLRGAILFWDGLDALLGDDRSAALAALLDVVAARADPTVLGGAAAWEPVGALRGTRMVHLPLPAPDATERLRVWRAALAGPEPLDEGALDLVELAGVFRLPAGRIADAAATAQHLALARDPDRPVLTAADLRTAARRHSHRHLATLARAIVPRAGWDDLVLPAERTAQLREVADQVRHRAVVHETWGFDAKLHTGRGLVVLFSGPPGTGKTMAAEVLAHTLGLDLYAIDLSAMVSKYIGETEKNLARVFADAASSNAVLFFDEADALFGRRSAVRDAHDRYANTEISYLLQRVEAHDGLVVLASNLRKNMDEAFVRRLHATVEFPVPGPSDRRRIWQRTWPTAAPLAPDVDFDLLAREVEVAGGHIRNIALAAAFLAAADGGVVTMEHLRRSTAREYQKMGKVRVREAS